MSAQTNPITRKTAIQIGHRVTKEQIQEGLDSLERLREWNESYERMSEEDIEKERLEFFSGPARPKRPDVTVPHRDVLPTIWEIYGMHLVRQLPESHFEDLKALLNELHKARDRLKGDKTSLMIQTTEKRSRLHDLLASDRLVPKLRLYGWILRADEVYVRELKMDGCRASAWVRRPEGAQIGSKKLKWELKLGWQNIMIEGTAESLLEANTHIERVFDEMLALRVMTKH